MSKIKLGESEFDIAKNKVWRYIIDELHWPEELVEGYGRVPIMMGSSRRWGDYLCSIYRNGERIPWILFEVKKPGHSLDDAVEQAESYLSILRAPFFCVTDGDDYLFFVLDRMQSKRVSIEWVPIPAREYLESGEPKYSQTMEGPLNNFILELKRKRNSMLI